MCHLNSNNNSSRSTAISLLTGQFTISSFRCYYYYIVSYVYIFSAATYNNTHFPEQQSITKDSPRIVSIEVESSLMSKYSRVTMIYS